MGLLLLRSLPVVTALVVVGAAGAVAVQHRRRRCRRTGAILRAEAAPKCCQPRPLRERITVIVTTSPSPLNPSTFLVDKCMNSLRFAPGLRECPKIIVCDGYRLGDTQRLKKGRTTVEQAQDYEVFKERLRTRVEKGQDFYQNTVMCALNERLGFGHAVLYALAKVETDYCLIVQHDHPLVRPIDMSGFLGAMDESEGKVKYLALLSSATVNYSERITVPRYGVHLEPIIPSAHPDLNLWPLFSWFDRTHICDVATLRRILESGFVRKGHFIEDTWGQQMLNDIKNNGIEAHAKYGAFVVDDGCGVMTAHVDGRFLTMKNLRAYGGWKAAGLNEFEEEELEDSLIADECE